MGRPTKEEEKRRAELLARGLKVCSKCGRVLPVEQFSKCKTNKDELTSQCKECRSTRYQENKEQVLQYQNQYNEEHKEETLQYRQQYYQTPQGQIVAFNSNVKRKQRKEEQGVGITGEQWKEMMDFFDWKCAYSGKSISYKKNRSIDHIVPLVKDGANEIWNLVPMYRPYNSSKNDKDIMEWYTVQDFYSKERLDKILQWQEYAYNKWSNQEQNIKIKEI